MSQVKLTLRPPPNVDFVHGYPGIPPGGPERPQAAVKGAIEVRVGPQGVKAKWVRIELRKVETLPGGGMSNTFYDFVGPSPVNLWNSREEYELLRTQDFPFSIRIPESIPPSIALENRAGIQYELVASICTRGKKGFLRKRKSIVVSTQAAIIIDKHELHSTWPVYCQHETRQHSQEGGTLIVDRNQTCYGPGDRISVVATYRSDSLEGPVLRGFELTLRESTIFRAGPHGKKSAPQAKATMIGDSKLAINGALYVGAQHRAELTCSISPNHTTTSLNAARHIDITYILSVRAIVDGVPPIVLDLPVIVSNWQRNVSQEAIRRIGPAASLSLMPVNIPPANQSISRAEPPPSRPPVAAATLPISKDNYGIGRNTSANAYSLPSHKAGYQVPPTKVDELGYGAGSGYDIRPTHSHSNSAASNHQTDEFGTRPTVAAISTTGIGRRPNSAVAANRFTITNALPSEIPAPEPEPRQQSGSASDSVGNLRGPWPTAEDEKQRLYEAARAKVERAQGIVPRVITPPPQTPPAQPAASPLKTGAWLSAEEEKLRLFNKAQDAAKKSQGLESYSPPSSLHGRSDSDGNRAADLSRASSSKAPPTVRKQNSAAAMYTQAMSARNEHVARQQSATAALPAKPPVPQYLTAEQEKAALRRYEQAKLAVDRVQNAGYISEDAGSLQTSGSAPIAYEHLYPDNTPGASSSSPAPASDDLPPPFELPANVIPASHLSEKERLRRAYELQDAAAHARQGNLTNGSPPPFTNEPSAGNQPILSEKEIIRRKFEAQDAGVAIAPAGRASPPQPPPRSNNPSTRSPSSGGRTNRPTPAPPASPGKVMTAAEEKALLKAQYAAQDAKSSPPKPNGAGPSRPTSHLPSPPASPPAPPPLMPRPPVEYIQETQEEDARVSSYAMNGTLPLDDGLLPLKSNGTTPPLDMRPFTPFVAGFEHSIPPPPPLPPKPADG